MLFRKKRIRHAFFGELCFSDDQWQGSKVFGPSGGDDVGIQISVPDAVIDEKYERIWNDAVMNFEDIRAKTREAIVEYIIQDGEDSFVELKEDFNSNDIELETISIEKNKSVFLSWGLSPSGSDEMEYGVYTSYIDGSVVVLGLSH